MKERKDIINRDDMRPETTRELPAYAPMVDIFENQEEILVHADMPGVVKEDVSVNIDNGRLFLSGVRKVDSRGASTWEEFGSLEYRRTFSVPQTIDINKINAELKDGVLLLHLPKSEAAKPRQIEIKVA
ncbi:MAG: Hsp20/alpha crystallin family protein [Pseudomonadota bacterium]